MLLKRKTKIKVKQRLVRSQRWVDAHFFNICLILIARNPLYLESNSLLTAFLACLVWQNHLRLLTISVFSSFLHSLSNNLRPVQYVSPIYPQNANFINNLVATRDYCGYLEIQASLSHRPFTFASFANTLVVFRNWEAALKPFSLLLLSFAYVCTV